MQAGNGGEGQPLRIWSIQSKMVLAFLLLILLAMQFIGAYLLRALEDYYFEDERRKRMGEARLLAVDAAVFLGEDIDGAYDRDGLRQLTETFGRSRYLLAVLLDRQGMVLAASDPALEGQRIVHDFVLRILEGAPADDGTRTLPDRAEIRAYGAVPILIDNRMVGLAYVEGDLTVVYETLVRIREVLFSATLVALGLTALLAWFIARTITYPVKAITARAAQMAAGDFDQRIEVTSRDEIGRLAEMFNHLAGRLKDTLAEISDEKNKIEAIVTHMGDGVVALDRNLRLLFINSAARQMLNVREPEEALIGQHPQDLWPDLDIGDDLEAALKGQSRPSAGDMGVRLEREGRTLRASFAPIRSSDGSSAGAVWVMHDVTQLEKLESVRQEFVANVSHELRTPLTTIKSYIETLLQEESADPELQRHFLQVVDSEAERMVRLVKDLLELADLDHRRKQRDREYVRLSELVRQASWKFQAQIRDKNLDVQESYPADEPVVYVDPDRIQQVVLNILSNAIEFTPSGGRIGLEVSVGHVYLQVTVADTGVGIPPEDLSRIFERFYRVDKARSRTLGGTGLGLAIAREIIQAHGGQIGIQSTPGSGTRVWFYLPVEETLDKIEAAAADRS